MLKRATGPRFVGFVVVAVYSLLMVACENLVITDIVDPNPCCFVDYVLEVVNDSGNFVRIHIAVTEGMFPGPVVLDGWGNSRTDIFALHANEIATFMMRRFVDGRRDSSEDSLYVGDLSTLSFYDSEGETPFKSYRYAASGCGGLLLSCGDPGDDTLIYHLSSDRVTDRLFVVSADRPFYLERDRADRDLGRIVITFLPTLDSSQG